MKKRKVPDGMGVGSGMDGNLSFLSDVLSLSHSLSHGSGASFSGSGVKKKRRTSDATSPVFWDATGGGFTSGVMDEALRKMCGQKEDAEWRRVEKRRLADREKAGKAQRLADEKQLKLRRQAEEKANKLRVQSEKAERERRIAEEKYYRNLEMAQQLQQCPTEKRKVGRPPKIKILPPPLAAPPSAPLSVGRVSIPSHLSHLPVSGLHFGLHGAGLLTGAPGGLAGTDLPLPIALLKKRVGRPPKNPALVAALAGCGMGPGLVREDIGSDVGTGAGARGGSHEPLKLRRKRAGSAGASEAAAVLASMLDPDEEEAGGASIIKRRKRGELQIMVPGSTTAAGTVRGVAFGDDVKGGLPSRLTNMGPPDAAAGTGAGAGAGAGADAVGGAGASSSSSGQGGRRSTRGSRSAGPLSLTTSCGPLTSGPLTMSNLGHFPLESPFGLNSDGRPVHSMFGLNSSRDMMTGGGLGSNMTDSMRFDFDEVVQHFPSPRAGDRLGSSPGRWDAGINSVTSSGSIGSGIFFPESGYQQQRRAHSSSSAQAIAQGAQLMASATARSASGAATRPKDFPPGQVKENVLEKKFKRGPGRPPKNPRPLDPGAGPAGGNGNKRASAGSNASLLSDMSALSGAGHGNEGVDALLALPSSPHYFTLPSPTMSELGALADGLGDPSSARSSLRSSHGSHSGGIGSGGLGAGSRFAFPPSEMSTRSSRGNSAEGGFGGVSFGADTGIASGPGPTPDNAQQPRSFEQMIRSGSSHKASK